MKTLIAAGSAALALVAMSGPAFAQAYPAKPIHLIVPAPVGAPPDVESRIFATVLADVLGHPVLVENRPGAGGTIGTAAVANATPDGHTIGWGLLNALALGPALFPNAGYASKTAFAPISRILSNPAFLLVHPSIPATTLREFVEFARARPGKLNFGSAGAGTFPHIAMEMLKGITGLDMVHVPFRGAHFTTLVAGDVQVSIESITGFASFVKAGRARVLATAGASRHPDYPDVPTAVESGIKFEADAWAGLIAPRGTPATIVARLNEATRMAIATPAARERFASLGVVLAASSPEAFGAFIASEVDRWTQAWKASGAKLD